MAKPVGLLLICATLMATVTAILSFQVTEASGSQELSYYFPVNIPTKGRGCRGSSSIGECLNEDGFGFELEDDGDEFQMDSESHRRILYWRRRYISYGALFRDRVPCSRRGASYYNCRPGAPANPYRRGCSTITRCRG